jgi:hypothetical protein
MSYPLSGKRWLKFAKPFLAKMAKIVCYPKTLALVFVSISLCDQNYKTT